MRTGLWISGAGGSGVLVARQENGEWSPPSGIMLHTAGLGFLVGIDIYDCVLVINNRKALESFTKIRATVGGEISAVAGPVGVGGVLENDGKWKQANRPVFTYLKSRGFYAGVQVDGTIVIERTDENARFYNETAISVTDIFAGKVRHPPREIRKLMETLKAAEGRTDVDAEIMEELEGELAPADQAIGSPSSPTFGVPEEDDPDPYGVAALEKEGLSIVEAGSHTRVSSDQFEYRPRSGYRSRANTATSPTPNRTSFGAYVGGGHNPRWSQSSARSTTSDAATQTGRHAYLTPDTSPSASDHSPRDLTNQAPPPSYHETEQDRARPVEKVNSPYSSGEDGRRAESNEDGEFFEAEEAAWREASPKPPVVLPKGPPPMLPPRNPPVAAPEVTEEKEKAVKGDFEDLDLTDSKK